MKNIVKSIIAIAVLLQACTKNVLNKPPLDSYTDASVWTDLSLTEAYANNLYNILPTVQHNWDNKSSRSWALSAACDEGYNKFNDYNESVLNKGTLTPDNLGNFDIWSLEFYNIQNCNTFLSKIDAVPGDSSVRNRLKGEVLYLRAFAYYMLVRDYGGVPLFSKPFDLNSNFKATRASFDECVNFIVADCDAAASLLPVNYASSDAKYGKATKGASMALKSTILLYAASPFWNDNKDATKWQKAADAAKAVIDLGAYQLYSATPYCQLFVKPNPELIMVTLKSAKYSNSYTDFTGIETFLAPNGFHGWSSFAPSQQLVDAFNTADGKLITDATSGYNNQNPYANRDPRFYNDILFDGRPFGNSAYCQDRYSAGGTSACQFYEGGLDSKTGFDNWNYSLTRYSFRKYQDTTFNFNTGLGATNHFWVISRLSEIYLNYAEAQYNLGNNAEAIKYLNLVRQRPGVNLPALDGSLSGTELFARIQNERQVELCLEGHRYYDVRRWKIAESTQNAGCRGVTITLNGNVKSYSYGVIQTRAFNSPANYLLPIPRAEIQRTSLQQNPGYQ
ncbi:RagB/SusD family nutrient uptake outer membrane protein [Chitinophagaceae bacterium 26-R-25]|nr:RagB/SusD family nutrient uptake outer membrane protein [Chitinophagaceae bacterium 26-R-25]